MSAVKQLNEALNHFHLGADARPSGSETPNPGHPAKWSLPEIDKFAFSLDRIIKENPHLTELRTAQTLIFHLTGKVHLAREALK